GAAADQVDRLAVRAAGAAALPLRVDNAVLRLKHPQAVEAEASESNEQCETNFMVGNCAWHREHGAWHFRAGPARKRGRTATGITNPHRDLRSATEHLLCGCQ